MIHKEQSLFVLVDVQGKLAKQVHDSEFLLESIKRLINGMHLLGIPIIWLEQYPKGLGATTDEIQGLLPGNEPIEKMTFNACKNSEFLRAIKASGRKQILIAGIETHVCVYQTAAGLIELGYDVEVVEDAVSSRTLENKQIGISKMKSMGVAGTSVEMALFELMETAEGELFKKILPLIK